MSFDYTRARATAERLIANFGQTMTLAQSAATGDPWDPVLTDTDHTATGAVMEYTDRQIDGARIRVGDKLVYLSTDGLSVTPGIADKLSIGGVVHQIINIKPLSPAGVVVFYELQARS